MYVSDTVRTWQGSRRGIWDETGASPLGVVTAPGGVGHWGSSGDGPGGLVGPVRPTVQGRSWDPILDISAALS